MKALMNPSTYANRPGRVDLVQTHISWVFIAEDQVYKVKKPVDFGFLDFTSLEKRKHFCEEELRLNQRLCPEIYLEVLPITNNRGEIRIGDRGEIMEWALRMNRMPEEGMMGKLIEKNLIDTSMIDLIIQRLIPFYEKASRDNWVRNLGGIDIVTQNTEENFEQTIPFIDKVIERDVYDKIRGYTRNFIKKQRNLFLSRVRESRIVEGHGDLYSANICLDSDNRVYIFDCIEFNERFRCGDVASDVAFLAMDLDYHGLPALSRHFTTSMAAGLNDPDLERLINFYKCYRAYVRGKIGCFTWASEGLDQEIREKSREQASRYFQLALRYAGAQGNNLHLYVFFGLSGTGKSTLSQAFASSRKLSVFNSDRIRKEMVAGINARDARMEPFGQGIYSPEMTKRTYRALSRLAARELLTGHSVVLDATYSNKEERLSLMELAKDADANIHFILCTCPEPVIRERLSARKPGGQVSDAGWDIYLKQKGHFHPADHLPATALIQVDTTRPLDELVREIGDLEENA